jgi:DNA-binding transcriptional LysR family regulator
MHPGKEHKGDRLSGISAVLAAHAGLTELEGAVLDLAAVLDGLVGANFEIIVVRAAATPQVADLLAELRVRYPTLPLRLHEGKHVSQEAALAAGFDAAAYDLILASGANAEIDVRETNHLLDAIEHGADLAIGYRPRRADGIVRRLHGWGWNVLVSLLFGQTGRDVDCPFKLFRTVVWQRVDVHPRSTSPTFNAEILVRARRLGFCVAEVPVSHRRPRQAAPRRAAGPTEIGRALVQLSELRRGVSSQGAAARREVPSLRFAPSMRAATGEQRHSPEPRSLTPDL